MKNENININNSAEHTTVFSHPSHLNTLSTFSLYRKYGLGKLKLPDSFEYKDKANLEQELNRNYYACGCSEGANGLLLFLVGSIVYTGFIYYQGERSVFTLATSIAGISLIGAILGKFIGLYQANNKLKRTINTIQAHWEVENIHTQLPNTVCG